MFAPGDVCKPNRRLIGLHSLLTYEVERVEATSPGVKQRTGCSQLVYLVGDGWPRRAEHLDKVEDHAQGNGNEKAKS